VKRYLEQQIRDDLKKKMVFVGGPRQVGKTTLAFSILKGDETHPGYLNWDYVEDKRDILQGKIPSGQPLLVLDEIHKYKEWRNLVKGLYDKRKSSTAFFDNRFRKAGLLSKGWRFSSGTISLPSAAPSFSM